MSMSVTAAELGFESVTLRRRASFLRSPILSLPQQLENVLPQKQSESRHLKCTEKKKKFTRMEAGRPYLSTHAIFTAVLIVLVYRLLFHLQTQSLSKEQRRKLTACRERFTGTSFLHFSSQKTLSKHSCM